MKLAKKMATTMTEKLGCDVDWNPDGGIITITK